MLYHLGKEMLVITLLSGQQRVNKEKQAELQIYTQRLKVTFTGNCNNF